MTSETIGLPGTQQEVEGLIRENELHGCACRSYSRKNRFYEEDTGCSVSATSFEKEMIW